MEIFDDLFPAWPGRGAGAVASWGPNYGGAARRRFSHGGSRNNGWIRHLVLTVTVADDDVTCDDDRTISLEPKGRRER